MRFAKYIPIEDGIRVICGINVPVRSTKKLRRGVQMDFSTKAQLRPAAVAKVTAAFESGKSGLSPAGERPFCAYKQLGGCAVVRSGR